MKKNVTISVVIPTHNRGLEMQRAIMSVIHQTKSVNEIWVIDDASTEELFSLPIFSHSNLIRYYRLMDKANANVARNKGVELSQSDFIAFLDSDDEWKPNHIENFLNHDVSLIDGYFSGSEIIRETSGTPIIQKTTLYNKKDSPMNFLFGGGFAQTSSYIIKKNKLRQCLFDPNLKRHQDYDFFVRFHNLYNWTQSQENTVILHWERNRKVTRNAYDEMIFMRKNRHLLDLNLYKKYLRNQYDYYFQNGTKDDYSLHQNELQFIISQLTFSEYLSFFKERNRKLEKFLLLLQFLFYKIKN